MKSDKQKKFKCPYCKVKNEYGSQHCTNCNLDFRQLGMLSNKEAKKTIKEKLWGESLDGSVILTKDFPSDRSKWKTFFMCLFLGFFGMHNIYVGKYSKGWTIFALSIIAMPFFIIGAVLGGKGLACSIPGLGYINFYLICAVFASLPTFTWVIDNVLILFGQFEVPVKLRTEVQVKSKFN